MGKNGKVIEEEASNAGRDLQSNQTPPEKREKAGEDLRQHQLEEEKKRVIRNG